MKIVIILIFGVFLNVCGFTGAADNQMQKYGEKVPYADGKEIKFPDFSIKFLGKREEKLSKDLIFPLKMTFYDFEAAKGEKKEKISWSSGMGDIAPTVFEFDGANYVLELSQSDIFKSLGEGVFVIWKKADYDEAIKKKTN
jgi:hypothetical protein